MKSSTSEVVKMCSKYQSAMPKISWYLILAHHMTQNVHFVCFSGHITHFLHKMYSLQDREASARAWAAYAWRIHYAILVLNKCINSTMAKCQKGAKMGYFYPCFCHTNILRGSQVLIFASLKRSSSKVFKDDVFSGVHPM